MSEKKRVTIYSQFVTLLLKTGLHSISATGVAYRTERRKLLLILSNLLTCMRPNFETELVLFLDFRVSNISRSIIVWVGLWIHGSRHSIG